MGTIHFAGKKKRNKKNQQKDLENLNLLFAFSVQHFFKDRKDDREIQNES